MPQLPTQQQLYAALTTHFETDELELLCFELGIDDQAFERNTKPKFAMNLVKYCQARGEYANLVQAVRKARPNISFAEAQPAPDPAATQAAVTAYHREVAKDLAEKRHIDTRFVRMRLLDRQKTDTSLSFAERDHDYQDLSEVLANEEITDPALVLLGVPGGGKTTLLRRLQWQIASDHAANPHAAQPVTLFVTLNKYTPDAPNPAEWLAQQWQQTLKRFSITMPPLDYFLAQGSALLLLDALNEMPHQNGVVYGKQVERWRDFLRDDLPRGNRAVFTCRSLDYSQTLSVKDDVDVRQITLKVLNPTQLEAFLRQHAPKHAAAMWGKLKDQPEQLALYATPYFAKILCDLVNERAGQIPASRAELFAELVRRAARREVEGKNALLLDEALFTLRDREDVTRVDTQSNLRLPERGLLMPKLSELAYAMQREGLAGAGGRVLLGESRACELLQHPRAREVLTAGVALTVLDEDRQREEFWFYHQLLQEFFAARRAAQQFDAPLAAIAWQAEAVQPSLAQWLATAQDYEPLPPLDRSGWAETLKLAAQLSAQPNALVASLMPVNLPLAAEVAAQVKPKLDAKLLHDLQYGLIARSQDRNADLRARIAAGEALGNLGDPRFERRMGKLGHAYLLPPMIAIEAGEYILGDKDQPYDDATHVHRVKLDAFRMGKFPVTNAEFACFIQAGGYTDPRWWDTPAAKAFRTPEGAVEGQREGWRNDRRIIKGLSEGHIDSLLAQQRITSAQARDWHTIRGWSDDAFEAWLAETFPVGVVPTQPRQWEDAAFNQPSQPVVGVCWHEARAYGLWLSAQSGLAYALPSEAQWEAAARGKPDRRGQVRAYAYGEKFEASQCNTFESHIRRSTPIGMFAEGETPEGVSDLCGNVWEWTSSAYLDYPYQANLEREDPSVENIKKRVVRGGSWLDDGTSARAAIRNNDHVDYRYHNYGFRLVSSAPLFSAPVSG